IELRLADLELRRVDAHREAARAGVDVVARERLLRFAVEAARRVERQRMRGYDGAAAQQRERRRGNVGEAQPGHGRRYPMITSVTCRSRSASADVALRSRAKIVESVWMFEK